MEREGKVRKARPPFDPASLALPPSFRSLFLGDCGQTSFYHSNHQAYPILRDAGKKKQGNNSSSFETISILWIGVECVFKVPTAVIQRALQGIEPNENSKTGLSMDCTITPIRLEDL